MSDDVLTVVPGVLPEQFGTLTGEWEIDPFHSSLEFVARYARFTRVRGRFQQFTGAVTFDGNNLSKSQVAVSIEAGSAETGFAMRDAHLRAPDFFNAETDSLITFASDSVTVEGPGRFVVKGDLTMRSKAAPVLLDLAFGGASPDQMGNRRLGFTGTSRVNRRWWGLNWDAALPGGGSLLDDWVDLDFAISLIPAGTIAAMMAARQETG